MYFFVLASSAVPLLIPFYPFFIQIWLLRNNLLEQLHIYPYLVLPSGNPRYRTEGLSSSSSSSSALNPNDPDRVNDQEAYLKELARSKKMFIRFECVRR